MATLSIPSTDHILASEDELIALTLQVQEIEAQRDIQCGKYREDKPPDFVLAFLDFEAELKKSILLFEDLRVAHSMAKAVDDDATVLEELRAEEYQAHQDRSLALRLSQGNLDIENLEAVVDETGGTEDIQFIAWSDQVTAFDDGVDDSAGPSLPYALRQREGYKQLPLRKLECVVCADKFHSHEAIRLKTCHHIYCKGCIKALFVRATNDETLFPPKCCGEHFPASLINAELSAEELQAFNSAKIEFSTANRIYCANSDCRKFIPLEQTTSDNARCTACDSQTCVHCKNLAHGGECPEDQALQAVIDLAQGEGWRRCFGCNAMVSLDTGCNHMTCKCSAEFCYTCGQKWKTCSCDIWEERNLYERAELVVDRNANHPMPAEERQRRVRDMQQELRNNHECDHRGRWERRDQYRRKGYVCEICDNRHWKYILACRHCHLTACEDCRRHRV